MDRSTRVQARDEAVCISHNTLGKGIDPYVLSPAMYKKIAHWALSKRWEIPLKNWPCVTSSAWQRAWVCIYIYIVRNHIYIYIYIYI